MKPTQPVSLQVASRLLDFRGATGPGQGVPPAVAEAQLSGAVALHNILAREGFAYLADEVGMGKTFVALGVVALLRYFNPGLRVAYISPRENIQEKWIKELRNFSRTHWLARDHVVRTLDDLPACEYAACGNLLEWARLAVRQPQRDVFLRLTSFSFPLAGQGELWRRKRDDLAQLARIDASELHLGGNKSAFKKAYARAINSLLPHYDLVVVDEAHNLKGGRTSDSARNQLIEMVLGTAEDQPAKHYGKRFDRVLFLSATPIESDFSELWNQLDLFGCRAPRWELLKDPNVSQMEKRELAREFLVRRLTGLSIGGEMHTKNMYRREWRRGGCAQHDEALEIPDARQRLIVALVQKKVAEVIGNPRFNKSFQMGMLASFESFAQTAIKQPSADHEEQASNFDHSDQTDEQVEREGIDSPAVNRIADSYRRTFKTSMPHPKMDSVVESLATLFDTGEKALIFVRRVRSVPELREKLCDRYDAWFRPALDQQLDPPLREQLAEAWQLYADERARRRGRAFEVEQGRHFDEETDEDARQSAPVVETDDKGGHDTFFSWFFRGEGPSGFLSGAAFRRNRFQSDGSVYASFFEDNHVAELLGWGEGTMLARLADALGANPEEVEAKLRDLAFGACRHRTGRQHLDRALVFEGYQAAALWLLSRHSAGAGDATKAVAKAMLSERFPWADKLKPAPAPKRFPHPEDFLAMRTFFTELRAHPALRVELWPETVLAPPRQRFRAREQRRELLAAVAGLGHAFVELWALAVNQLGSLREGRRDSTASQVVELIRRFLALLEQQRAARLRGATRLDAFHELSSVGKNHDLILAVNFPDVVDLPLEKLPRSLADTLGRQTPIAGMYGGISKTAVAQFRMPGYPLALIATDVLQEGEDLHTFCSKVFHYGISWTPSAMEQRTGRVDRIGSKAHRALDKLPTKPSGEALLQVHYPYLPDTVEVLQVQRVFERMNKFLRAIHHTGAEHDGDSRIDTNAEFARRPQDIHQIKTPLESVFKVVDADLQGPHVDVTVPDRALRQKLAHLDFLLAQLEDAVRVEWDPHDESKAQRFGTVFVDGDRLAAAGDGGLPAGARRQPVALYLRTSATGELLLHGTSPVGLVSAQEHSARSLLEIQSRLRGTKVCRLPTKHAGSYTVTAEADLLFAPGSTHVEELIDMIQRIAVGADLIERELLPDRDRALDEFAKHLKEEAMNVTD